MTPMRRPRDRGQSPRTVRPPRAHSACTSHSCPSCLWFRGCRCGARAHCEAHAGMQGSLARERRPAMWNPRVRGWGL
eukprot:scaffold23261_cov51-Phaeocystis_antarctica.AAC.4